MTNHTVLLAGATGMFGSRIAHHMLDADDVRLKALIRPDAFNDPAKRDHLDNLRQGGAELITGDLGHLEDLERATGGVDVVVSALQGDRDVIVDGQIALARAAAANGVARFLPSDYAIDLFKATPGEHHPFDLRREADEQIARLGIDVVHVLNGAFLDGIATPGAVIEIDEQAKTGTFWGAGDEPFEATTIENTARYIVHAAIDPDVQAGKFAVGQTVTFAAILEALGRAAGHTYTPHSRGSVDDLREWTQEQRDANNEQMATIGTYLTYMLSGQTRLENLQNDNYPDIPPTTLDDVIAAARRPDQP